MIFPSLSHDFPIIFPSFSHHFPIILPWFSHHCPIIFPSFSHDFPIIFPSFFHHFSIWSHICPTDFPKITGQATDFFTELRKNPPKVRIAWVAQILVRNPWENDGEIHGKMMKWLDKLHPKFIGILMEENDEWEFLSNGFLCFFFHLRMMFIP